MSYGVNSFGVGSFGAPVQTTGGGAGTTVNCGVGSASASGFLASITSLPAVDFKIAVIGDSNASGRCTNNQPAPPSGAYLYDNAGSVVALADPWDGGTNTYSILDDGASADGSFIPRLAQHYYDAGKTTLWVPANKGGTQTSNWTRSTLTTTHYGAMKARIDAVGGVNKIVICLGANDAIAAVSQSTFVTRMNQLIADLKSDFPSAQLYLQKIQDFTGYGTQVQTIRAGVQQVWENNADVKRGADLDGITTSVHYTTDADAIAVGSRTYAALEGVTVLATQAVATASGFDASVSNNGGVTVSCSTATASASGLNASVSNATAITASIGTASASGLIANIQLPYAVAASVATVIASGRDATVTNVSSATVVNCSIASVVASGLLASIQNGSYVRAPSGSGPSIIRPSSKRQPNTYGKRV